MLNDYASPNAIKVEVELRGEKVLHEYGARGQIGIVTRILDVGDDVTLTLHGGENDGKQINLKKWYERN